MNRGGALDLQVDKAEGERRKRAKLVRLNTLIVPRMRLLGFACVAAAALLHDLIIYPGPGGFTWGPWFRLLGILGGYSLLSWYLLHIFYEDLRPQIDLGTIFLGCDMAFFSVAIHYTGAERSWIFFLPLIRVLDQSMETFRRALAFGHLAPLSYAAVLLYARFWEHRTFPIAPELAKIAFLYLSSVYMALIARTGEARHRRSTEVIRLAKHLILELGEKSKALERSSKQLHNALDQQAELHKENARLFGATEAREARLAQILHSTSDGIIFIGPDARIEAANVRAGDLLGFDPKSVIGTDVMRIFARLYSLGDGDSFEVILKALLADPGPGAQGDLQQPSTGRVLHWVAQPTRDNAGGTIGLTFTFQDVTPTRDLVRQLEDKTRLLDETRRRADEADRVKTEFVGNVTGELRTPLNAILALSAQLLDDKGASDRQDPVRRLKASAESLQLTINDLVDLSRIDARTLTLAHDPMQLRDVLREVIETVEGTAADKGLSLVLDVRPEVPDELVGDSIRLRQVLVNLIGNAIKFTQSGDIRVRVDVASQVPGEICLHFAVLDTGVGIPRDKQQLVFEAFSWGEGASPRRGGAGLGLSISARLVDLMGGDIWVESEVGRGSAFRFTANFGVLLSHSNRDQ
jgi:PAS domain S-box-containing protein